MRLISDPQIPLFNQWSNLYDHTDGEYPKRLIGSLQQNLASAKYIEDEARNEGQLKDLQNPNGVEPEA